VYENPQLNERSPVERKLNWKPVLLQELMEKGGGPEALPKGSDAETAFKYFKQVGFSVPRIVLNDTNFKEDTTLLRKPSFKEATTFTVETTPSYTDTPDISHTESLSEKETTFRNGIGSNSRARKASGRKRTKAKISEKKREPLLTI